MSEENSKNSLPGKTEPNELNDLQKMFVAEYLMDFNATQAAIRAGYSDNAASAQVQGSRLLSNVMVARAIRAGVKDRAEKLGITADDILLRALKVFDMCTKGEPVMAWNGEEMAPTGEWEFDSKGANMALAIMGKLLGCFMRDKGGDDVGKQNFIVQINTGTKEARTIEGSTRPGAGLPVINITGKDT